MNKIKRIDFDTQEEYQKAYGKAWNETNKEYNKAYQKRYIDNKKKHDQNTKKYYHSILKFDEKFKKKRKENLRIWSLKTQYGLTEEEYKNLLEQQDYKCAICRSGHNGSKDWNVDHCHKTGKIRGLLCQRCNQGLGHFQDDIDLLCKAIEYLKDDSNRNSN